MKRIQGFIFVLLLLAGVGGTLWAAQRLTGAGSALVRIDTTTQEKIDHVVACGPDGTPYPTPNPAGASVIIGGTPTVTPSPGQYAGAVSQKSWTYVATVSTAFSGWHPVSVSFTASDSTAGRAYRIIVRNEDATATSATNTGNWLHNNATTTPTTLGESLLVGTGNRQVDDVGYDTNCWFKSQTYTPMVLEVWKR